MKKKIFGILLSAAMVVSTIVNPMVTAATETVSAQEIESFRKADGNHIAPTAPSGKVFAGWYTDDTYAEPIPEEQLTGLAVPKWVDANVLTAKWQMTAGTKADSATTKLRLVTTVDSKAYKEVGFVVNNGTMDSEPVMSKTVYSSISGIVNGQPTYYYPGQAFCEESQFFMIYEVGNVPNSVFTSIITVKPQWETLDGTVVTGTSTNFKIKEVAANVLGSATVTSNASISALNSVADGDFNSSSWRQGTDITGDYIQFNWANPVSVNKFIMTVTQARNCAPTAYRIQVSKDGESNWDEATSVSGIAWTQLGKVFETSELAFPSQTNIKGLRVYIDAANLVWGGYTIVEMEAYDDPALYDANYALTSTITTNTGANTSYLNNGNYESDTWRSGTPNGDYFQFNWASPISANKLTMVTSKSHYCLPTEWHVEVSKDGETGWTQVAAASVSSHEYGDVKLHTTVTFALQENIKGVRVCIDAPPTNTGWGGYGIREIEIYYDMNLNYALGATITTNNGANASTTAYLNNGNYDGDCWISKAPAGDYYQFNWSNAISASKVLMTVSNARNCAPTAWRVEVSADGQNNWREVASVSDIAWTQLGDVKETSELTFTQETSIKGIRVYIDAAITAWGGYGIREIEIY